MLFCFLALLCVLREQSPKICVITGVKLFLGSLTFVCYFV